MRQSLIMATTVLCIVFAQQTQAELYRFDSNIWQVDAEESEFVTHLGEAALRLKGGDAVLRDLHLTDGIIEFDISVSAQRGFSGAIFRIQDSENLEHFYIRPHQSGNPDANQYTPVFNGISAWQLYYGKGHGAPVDYRFDQWMHIKVAFKNSRAEVFIDSDEPVLLIDELMRPIAAGNVGVNASNFAEAYFANFEVSPLPHDYVFAEAEDELAERAESVVASWLISDAFNGVDLEGVTTLDKSMMDDRRWTELAANYDGKTNMARIQGLASGKNTAFARLSVHSDRAQIKGVSFGYSDSVAVFANKTLLYSGSNDYMSRDYRYLGTIGFFDKVYLPLKSGDNEIWFAVTEAFGGWGIQAQFDDLDGISID
jgi:hypothetical protein